VVLVGRQDRHQIGPGDRVRHVRDLEPVRLGLGTRGRAGAQADRYVDAAVAQVAGVRMALRAIADDGDFLALDDAGIAVFVVVNLHDLLLHVMHGWLSGAHYSD
jgi:hypothetical protein